MESHVISTLVLWMLVGVLLCTTAEKLSPGQKAPPHATNSGGGGLKAPFGGQRAADVGSRPDVGRSGGPKSPPRAPIPSAPKEEGVIREETDDIKEVDGKPVRVVKGSLAYDSPEGLPVSVKYEADENGSRASFTIGKPGGGSGGGGRPGGGSKPRKPDGGAGGGRGGSGGGSNRPGGKGGGGSGGTTYLPPMNVDKSYLPPS